MKVKSILTLVAVAGLFIGCQSNQGSKADLVAHEWQLYKMTNNESDIVLSANLPNVQFTDTNTMFGFAGCNRFFGSYTVKGNELSIKPSGMTMMACPDMEFESKFMKAFSEMTSFSVKNDTLYLTDGTGKQQLVFSPKQQMVGNATDDHGCNRSAGYTWSAVLQDCIRVFEKGVRLQPVDDPEATTSAFIVFAVDSTQVEVFLPNEETHPVLDRRDLPKGGHAWNVEDDDTYNVRQIDGKWIIERRGNLLYQESATPTKIRIKGSATIK